MEIKLPSKDELLAKIVAAPKQKKLAVMAGIILALIVGFYYFSISEERSKIESDKKAIVTLTSQKVEKQGMANHLIKYRREVERLNQELRDAVTLLPNEAEIPELLQKLSEQVEKSGLQMDSFVLSPEVPQGFYSKVPVRIDVTGSFHEIVVFLDKLAKLPRIVNVTDINMRDPVFKSQKMILKTSFLATTFRFIESKPQGGAQPPAGK